MDVSLQSGQAGGQVNSVQPFGITINGMTGGASSDMGLNGRSSVDGGRGMRASLQSAGQVTPVQSVGNAMKLTCQIFSTKALNVNSRT